MVRPAHPRLAGCTVHRTLRLDAADVIRLRGVAVTSPGRTLVDVAPRLSAYTLARTVDEGLVGGAWTPAELSRLLSTSAGRPGSVALRRVLAARTGTTIPAGESALEQRAIRALSALGPFETQHQVVVDAHVYVLDMAWPAHRVGVECDGWFVRGRSRGKFDRDRRRNNALASAGWTIVHLTAAMSDDEMRAAVFRVLMGAARLGRPSPAAGGSSPAAAGLSPAAGGPEHWSNVARG